MVIARRNLMGGKRLPYDAEVEWLKNDAEGPYIDTGIVVDASVEFDIDCCFIGDNVMCGAHPRLNNPSVYRFAFGFRPQVLQGVFYSFGGGDYQYKGYGNNGFALTRHIYSHIDGTFFIDGVTISRDYSNYLSGTRNRFYLFCISDQLDGRNVLGNGTILYGAKLKKGGLLVFDAIPVRFTNENGVSEGAMYDRVSKQLFRNAGTGAFIIGPDKVGTELAGGGINA